MTLLHHFISVRWLTGIRCWGGWRIRVQQWQRRMVTVGPAQWERSQTRSVHNYLPDDSFHSLAFRSASWHTCNRHLHSSFVTYIFSCPCDRIFWNKLPTQMLLDWMEIIVYFGCNYYATNFCFLLLYSLKLWMNALASKSDSKSIKQMLCLDSSKSLSICFNVI